MKKILCIALAISLCVFNSFGVLASNYAADQQYYQFVGDVISETTHISQALDEIGLSLQQIMDLPTPTTSFSNDADQYTTRLYRSSAQEAIPETLLGDRISHVTKMADQSVRRNPNLHLNPHMEVVYMYLSHYVDVRVPSDITSPVNSNSLGGTLGMYILPIDRRSYDIYMQRGSAARAGNVLMKLSTSLNAFSGNIKAQFEVVKTIRALLIKLYNFFEIKNNSQDSIENYIELKNIVFNSIENNISNAQSVEQLIELVNLDLALEKDYDTSLKDGVVDIISSIAVALAGGGVVGVAVSGAMLAADQLRILSKDFFDHVNWLSLSTTRNMRIADRTWEYMKYT